MACAKILHAWAFLVIQMHLHFQETPSLEVGHYTENHTLMLEKLSEKKYLKK